MTQKTSPASEGSDRTEPSAFGYRDWISEALNRHIPQSRLMKRQLPTDSMDADVARYLAALGFLSLGLTKATKTCFWTAMSSGRWPSDSLMDASAKIPLRGADNRRKQGPCGLGNAL